MTPESIRFRSLLWHFMDGQYQDWALAMMAEKIREVYAAPSTLTLLCAPGETPASHHDGWAQFSARLSRFLGMTNGFPYLHVYPRSKDTQREPIWVFDRHFFRDRTVLIVDSVVHDGDKLKRLIAMLENELGATVCGVMALAKRVNPGELAMHPGTGTPVFCHQEEEASTNEPDLEPYSTDELLTIGQWQGEPLQWMVIARRDDERLLMSVPAVDVRSYHRERKLMSWENCSLRQWLNERFLEGAFTAEEAARICVTQVRARIVGKIERHPGAETEDRLFILSPSEVEQLFAGSGRRWDCRCIDRIARPIWLRHYGVDRYHTAVIGKTGKIDLAGCPVNASRIAVRPVMWYRPGGLSDV